jgi:hypothetical protein
MPDAKGRFVLPNTRLRSPEHVIDDAPNWRRKVSNVGGQTSFNGLSGREPQVGVIMHSPLFLREIDMLFQDRFASLVVNYQARYASLDRIHICPLKRRMGATAPVCGRWGNSVGVSPTASILLRGQNWTASASVATAKAAGPRVSVT